MRARRKRFGRGLGAAKHRLLRFIDSRRAAARWGDDFVVAGMATMPSRAATFPLAFASLIRQVDRLYLYLDGHAECPAPARGDPRVVPPLQRATKDADALVRYEAGTALLRLGDMSGLDPVIAGLEDSDVTIRAKCILVLRDVTGSAFGYKPDDPPLDRQAAVARWKAWAMRQQGR